MGIGAGGMNTLPFIIYADIYPNLKQRGKVIGYATASYSAASIIGPLIGGWIVDSLSWHWVFYINVPLALLSVVVLQFFFTPSVHNETHKQVDYLGASLLILGLIALLGGIQLLGSGSSVLTLILLGSGLLLIGIMVKVEGKAEDPIIPNRLFSNQALVIDFLLFSIMWGAFVAFNSYVPMWAQGVLGLAAVLGGLTQMPGALTNFIGSQLGPNWQFKKGKYRVILYGNAAFLVSFIGMSMVNVTAPFWFILLMGAFEGFGLGLCFNVLQLSVQEDAEDRDLSIATSFAYLARILSQTFMSSIYGVILNHALVKGVRHSHGKVTIEMMNQLSDTQAARFLPQSVIPAMRKILFAGIHQIMWLATALLLLSFLVTLFIQSKETKTVKRKNTMLDKHEQSFN